MNHKHLLASLLLLFPLCLTSQTATTTTTTANLPTVQYSQGNITSNLPYGRAFYINGPNKIPDGSTADSIGVEIWKTPYRKIFRTDRIPSPSAQEIKQITDGPSTYRAAWLKGLAVDTSNFTLYINQMLEFHRLYILKFTFAKNFTLSESKREDIINTVKSQVEAVFKNSGGVGKAQIKTIIEREVTKALNAYPGDYIRQGKLNLPFVPTETLEGIATAYGKMTQQQGLLKNAKDQLAQVTPDDDPADVADLNATKTRAEAEIARLQSIIDNNFLIVKTAFVDAYSTFVIAGSGANSVAEINSINIGTSFGASVVGLNFQEKSQRAYDVFGYAALKFYLLPVDKKVADPYLADVFFINRLSILVGMSLSGDIDYNGSNLDKVLSVYPVLGLSYDVNRYLTIDVGATMFEQQSLSPLTNVSNVRVAPLIGINLDIDALNRMKQLISGQGYKVMSP